MSESGAFRVWRESDVDWSDGACEAPGCFRRPELLADFDEVRREGVPVCLEDAEVLLERSLAVELAVVELPDPWELARRRRGWRPRPVPAWASPHADRTPEKWLAEAGYYGEAVDTSNPDWDIPF